MFGKKKIEISGTLNVVIRQIPGFRHVKEISFFSKGGIMRGNPVLSPLADPAVTSSPLLITFNGGSPQVVVDMIDPNASFDIPAAEFGGSGMATPQGDISPFGVGPAGPPFSFTIPNIPAARTVQAVNFIP